MSTPDDLRYTAEHEWVRAAADGTVRLGITDYAQNQLGDIVYVQLPDEGTAVAAGDAMGEVESTKSVSDVYAPLAGTVTAKNGALDGQPDLVNSDPYGAGWLIELRLEDAAAVGTLLEAGAYDKLVEES